MPAGIFTVYDSVFTWPSCPDTRCRLICRVEPFRASSRVTMISPSISRPYPSNGSGPGGVPPGSPNGEPRRNGRRAEEHTSELQSRRDLVCRLLLEKKKKRQSETIEDNNTIE